MKKKTLIITALVLAAALAGGIWWYASRPAPVEEPEDQQITANPEPAESTPETEEEEPEPAAPEESAPVDPAPEDDPYGIADMTPEELDEFIANIGSDLDEWLAEQDAKNAEQQQQDQNQQQQPSGNQQQQGGGQHHLTPEELEQRIKDAGGSMGTTADNKDLQGSTTGDGSLIHW